MHPATAILTTAVLLAAVPIPAAAADHQTTLTGNFMSSYQDRVQPLRAVFTPAEAHEESSGEEENHDVVFHFRFNGRNHEYRGTAQGSLTPDGELAGQVQNESRQRTFTFKGGFEKGVFKGTHAEIGRRGERRTGSLTLRGPKS